MKIVRETLFLRYLAAMCRRDIKYSSKNQDKKKVLFTSHIVVYLFIFFLSSLLFTFSPLDSAFFFGKTVYEIQEKPLHLLKIQSQRNSKKYLFQYSEKKTLKLVHQKLTVESDEIK